MKEGGQQVNRSALMRAAARFCIFLRRRCKRCNHLHGGPAPDRLGLAIRWIYDLLFL